MLRSHIEKILIDQEEYLIDSDDFIPRYKSEQIDVYPGFATIITGIRRSGKSTLLRSMAYHKEMREKALYLHFDDPRLLDFKVDDFYTLEDIKGKDCTFYFDEIHQVKDWERYIRQATERKISTVITGSNASMLSTELATLLTGRHLSYELFPFDFEEYCRFHNLKTDPDSLTSYMNDGGFPEYLTKKNPIILQQLLIDILQRDIVARYSIRNSHLLNRIAMHLINNIARPYTLNKLARSYQVGSVNTVASYLQHFENAYLLFSISKFDHSFKKQLVNEKKIYAIDTGLVNSNTIKNQEDTGRLFENMIFLHLRRQGDNVYYFKQERECDFVISKSDRVITCYQVCYQLDRHNEEREIKGLLEAMDFFNHDIGYLITGAEDDELRMEGRTIRLLSAHNFLKK